MRSPTAPPAYNRAMRALHPLLLLALATAPVFAQSEAVKLFVVKVPHATLTSEELIAYCRKELTGYKIPKHVSFIDALPKSAVGKILRRDLRTVA